MGVIILAAGQGARMLSARQKILHEVGGRPMIAHLFDEAAAVAGLPPVLVVGEGEAELRRLFDGRAEFVRQPEQLGTGHAAQVAAPLLEGRCQQVLITYADMPLLGRDSMQRLAERQRESGAPVAMLTVLGRLPSSFGRVVRGPDGRVQAIVEVAQARRRPDGDQLLAIREQNPGLYCFEAAWLWRNLPRLPLRQARNGREYYLTDLIGLAIEEGSAVEAVVAEDADEGLGAGDRAELALVERAFRQRQVRRWQAAGVTVLDPDSTYIDASVSIGRDTVIYPGSHLSGRTAVGPNCVIGPNAILRDAKLGAGCRVESAVVEAAELGDGVVIPPFSRV
ncbi:MAG: NTP transferase domain-containing protein [Candidatus Promineifilaceae bacterium]